MTTCPTCGGNYDPLADQPPPPATSSTYARRQALAAARAAVERVKGRSTPAGSAGTGHMREDD